MNLIIRILQKGKEVALVRSELKEELSAKILGELFNAEFMLNSLPNDLRIHIHVED